MGVLWDKMDARPRRRVRDLSRADVPEDPGVYAFYRRGKRIYVGKAGNLLGRVRKAHCGQNKSLGNSAFRRNVSQHLGISTPARIKDGSYRLSDEERARVRAFVDTCEVAWITRPSESQTVDLETRMKVEYVPPLTKV